MLTWFNTGGVQFPALVFVTPFVPQLYEPSQDPVLAQFAYEFGGGGGGGGVGVGGGGTWAHTPRASHALPDAQLLHLHPEVDCAHCVQQLSTEEQSAQPFGAPAHVEQEQQSKP